MVTNEAEKAAENAVRSFEDVLTAVMRRLDSLERKTRELELYMMYIEKELDKKEKNYGMDN